MGRALTTVICRRGARLHRAVAVDVAAAVGLIVVALVTFGSVTMVVAGSFAVRYAALAVRAGTYSARFDSGLITVRHWPAPARTILANRIEMVRTHTDRVVRYGRVGATIWGPVALRRGWIRHDQLVALFDGRNRPAVVLDRRADGHRDLARALLERLPATVGVVPRGLLTRDVADLDVAGPDGVQVWRW